MLKMSGIAASKGIALAKALIIKDEKIKINNKKINQNDIESEILKFQTSINKTITEIENIIQETILRLGQENTRIFEAHLQIAKDPELIEKVKKLISQEKFNAANALNTVADEFITTFKAMEDEYFRERVVDIIDVRNRILRKILNVNTIDLSLIKEAVIIISNDLTPSQTSQLNPQFIKGFLCNIGGITSHAAIMARSIGIPAVLGLKDVVERVKNDQFCALNGTDGVVEIDLNALEQEDWKQKQIQWQKLQKDLLSFVGKDSQTKDNYSFKLEANIGSPKDIENVLQNDAQGVGLFRTEFLYMENDNFPSEEQQFNEYKSVLEKIKHRVVIRTLDIGGDKELSYLKLPKEMNPFLGYRAIRLCLDRKDIFKTQLRALFRASVYGQLAIMFPMIATIEEFKSAKAFALECKKQLVKEGFKVSSNIQIGMMIEIPAAAINAHMFAKYADFFSIGTNDLIQYSLAVDRMSEKVSYLYQPYHPAILRLIKTTIDVAHANNIPVAMCGEMASDKIAIPLLVGMGLDEFSMSPSSILSTRKIISTLNKKEMEKLVTSALELETNDDVKKLVSKIIDF